MKRLLEQLDAIEAIVDTVSPKQIEENPSGVASRYEVYANSYDPLDKVKTLRDRLVGTLEQGNSVNGYLSADYGYGKTATLVYLWHECQQQEIVAVPPFKFKELDNLIVATSSWIKTNLESSLHSEFDEIYNRYNLQSQMEQATQIAKKFRISEKKALQIVQQYQTNDINTDTVLGFWQETTSLLKKAGKKGLIIFADETQEFLRTEEGSNIRIQILSDLVKGMRALGNIPIGFILGMPTNPTESAIEEQAGDIIHRMQEQKMSLQLADVYDSEFPKRLWAHLCDQFLDSEVKPNQVAHPATIESLAQLCDRKDLTNGPRTIIEVLNRIVHFVRDNNCPYTPVELIEDYLEGKVQFYGVGQHRINHVINTLQQLPPVNKHPQGMDVIKLMAAFPAGVSESVAKEMGLLESLREVADDDYLYGIHITQPTSNRYALIELSQSNPITVVDKILNRFRQSWFREWIDVQKQENAATIFRSEIIPLLFPISSGNQKANWTWRYPEKWQEDRFGFYNFLTGAPERYNLQFPQRSLVVSVGTNVSTLMSFTPPEETHLDWRFYLNYDSSQNNETQQITAIAGTGQIDFNLQLSRSFTKEYPRAFGLLKQIIPPEECSACTLLNLSQYIQEWLLINPEVSQADRERLEQHRRECHQYAINLLFPPVSENSWMVEGIDKLEGGGRRLFESAFFEKCKSLFPNYQSFYNYLGKTLNQYKSVLKQIPLNSRRGNDLYVPSKSELEKLFETTGSGLPSILGILQSINLVDDYKIAGKQEENSQLRFTQHPLENYILEQLENKGQLQFPQTEQNRSEIKLLSRETLWQEIKEIGYLKEEFEEALQWLELRRYIEWNRSIDTVYQVISDLDLSELNNNFQDLKSKLGELLEVFNQSVLHELQNSVNEAEKMLISATDILKGEQDPQQLNLFNKAISNSNQAQSLSEVVLDQVDRKIKNIREQVEAFEQDKIAQLQQKLNQLKTQIKQLSESFTSSKIYQDIVGNSGLETCLDEHRINLRKQVDKFKDNCKKTVNLATSEESNILTLHEKVTQINLSFKAHKKEEARLSSLVAGLEKWRILLARAETLRNNLAGNAVQLQRYEEEFVDQVVVHFAEHQVEGFNQYEALERSLLELEEQINKERRSRREAFNQFLQQYETLLKQLEVNHPSLSLLCRFDDDDRQGSYATLKQLFQDKAQEGCDRVLSQLEKLEQDLMFLSIERDQDVSQRLEQVNRLKSQLQESREKLPDLIEEITALQNEIGKVSAIAQEAQTLQKELIQLQGSKDDNLTSEEKELLEQITSVGSKISITQLRQFTSGNDKIWEQLKSLYRKGHLEILVKCKE